MDQEKIGKFIKNLRKENNLTQRQLADKYGVTYQAVSKWENGKNLPDVSLIKQMSIDFNINIDDILSGEVASPKRKNKTIHLSIILGIVIILLLTVIIILYSKKDTSFKFKTISSNCSHFKLSGSIAYNKNKSSIHISNIDYCGGADDTDYKKIECILYESNNKLETKLDTFNYDKSTPIKLENFLQDISFNIDNHSSLCKQYKDNNLYLQINATDGNDKITSYKIPLTLKENCSG